MLLNFLSSNFQLLYAFDSDTTLPNVDLSYLGSDISWSSCSAEYGECRFDYDYQHSDRIEINGRFYNKGIVAHAHSKIVFTLTETFEYFYSCIGISKLNTDGRCGVTLGEASFQVVGDGNILRDWQQKNSPEIATCFEISISGVSQLTLKAKYDHRVCDLSTWADAKVYNKGTFLNFNRL